MFRTVVVQLSDEMEFCRRTALSSGYNRRKTESVNDLEIRQEERLQKVIDMHSRRRHRHSLCVVAYVVMHFILLYTVTCIKDVIDYHMNSIPVIKSQDDLVV